jgi:hypothetical protein
MARVFHRINILKFIAEQGVVTVDDISAYLYEGGRPETIRVNLHQLKLGHARFGYIKSGVWYIKDPKDIELLRTYHPDLPNFQVRPLLLYLVPHALEINSLRIALEKSPEAKVSRWWSEAYIRALPLPQWGGRNDSKIPDAIFWRKRNDGSEEKYFLEYERSLKNRERYEEIFRSYAERDDVENKNVIYICENEFIKSELQDVEAKMQRAGKLNSSGKCFQFVTREGFYKAYTNKPSKEGIQ